MPQDLLEKLKAIQSKATKNSKIIPKLVELKEETNRAFDEHIDHLLSNKGLLRRIKVPKSNIKLWKHKNKRVQIPINWRYAISAPFIYGMIIPSVIFHICIEIYHQICFRLYGIPLVKPKDYFIYDRQLLDMLKFSERVNCKYCSYVNNLLRYSTEIAGRTERYWCPIKYYRRINNTHSQYSKFVEGDNLEELHEKWEELRDFSDLQ